MKIVTVCDAHLRDASSAASRDFLQFLHDCQTQKVNYLVINGDLFEFLIGRQPEALKRYQPIIQALIAASQDINIVMIEGNHDFHLRRVFPQNIVVAQQWQYTIAGQTILWLHGDTLGATPAYRVLRRFLRSAIVRAACEYLPARFIWHVATRLADTSRDYSGEATTADFQKMLPPIQKLLDQGYHAVMTGHLHQAYQQNFSEEKGWLAMGDWLRDRYYFVLSDEAGILNKQACVFLS